MARVMYVITRSSDLLWRLRSQPRLFVGAAWFFIVFSLAHLAWVISVKWADPSGLTTLYQATVDGETVRAWGLAYSGVFGLLLAMAQFLLIAAATVMSLRRRARTRRIGHGILIGWAALWAINLLWLAGFDMRIDSLGQAVVMCFLLGCTIYRAACTHPSRAREASGAAQAEGAPEQRPSPAAPAEFAEPAVPAPHHNAAGDEVNAAANGEWTVERGSRAFARARRAARGIATATVGGARRVRPLLAVTGRGVAAGGQRLAGYLRDKGVIPQTHNRPGAP
jgi:hypothetical protein